MKVGKLMLTLPLIGFSIAANAEILLDAENNVSYTGHKNSTLAIKADGTATIDGTLIKKCEGDEGGKITKAPLGNVSCDDGFVVLKDKKGNILSRFSSYALATDSRGTNERKLFDPNLAKLGSPSTNADEYSETQTTTVETIKTTTTNKLAPGEGYLNRPKIEPAKVNETIYTPKLGVMSEKTPSITKQNKPGEYKLDKAVMQAEKAARAAPPGTTVPMPPITQPPVVETQISPSIETKTTTTVFSPRPAAEAAGVPHETKVKTETNMIPPDEEEEKAGEPIPTP